MKKEEQHLFHGVHVFGEIYGVSPSDLDNLELLEKLLCVGIEKSGATLCSIQSKQFEPKGLTLLALLSESHASIHTYPDEGALFFDAFTCGTECQPQKIADSLINGLNPNKVHLQTINRGESDISIQPSLAESKVLEANSH